MLRLYQPAKNQTQRSVFVSNSRSCSECHISITLEMSQQICGTKGAQCLLLTEASWDLTTTSSLQTQNGLSEPCWDHPELQLLSAVTATLFKPCPAPAQLPGHI